MYFCRVKPNYVTKEAINEFITSAIKEDIGEGDHSSLASIPAETLRKARLVIKDDGVIAGLELAKLIFHHIDRSLEVNLLLNDGDFVKKGDIGLTVSGSARSILSAERLLLNCMQRMSGIATYTRKMQLLISHTEAKILDTRKTTPNFRLPEKWAVYIGGGQNHRFGLFDMIMLKDNHIDFAGGITNAISATKKYLSENNKVLKIEVETRSLEEVQEVLEIGGIDVIMLDNMDTDMMKEAVRMINKQFAVEASGGITEESIRAIAECGVDFISVGALTHSVKSLDISLKAY